MKPFLYLSNMICTKAMEAGFGKRQLFKASHLGCCLLLMQLLMSLTFVECYSVGFYPGEVDALQSLLAAWNTSTPKSSLKGWS
uniref:Uncharacterized protein n=1 Tax=Physcomitrium patens TaxID=3218 RepID=A0A2K1JE43_PHYPA|nr:hypothetical protein PHYPA_020083 [Physcomitrium patens]